MLKLHVVQAEEGDSLIVEWKGRRSPRFVLVDGGPKGTYGKHLRAALQNLVTTRAVDLAVLSHVDDDHVKGLVELFAELDVQRVNGVDPPLVRIAELWHNKFSQTATAAIEARLNAVLAAAPNRAAVLAADGRLSAIAEGSLLAGQAVNLNIPTNPGFDDKLVKVGGRRAPLDADGMQIEVIGPTSGRLENLRKDWIKWLDTHEAEIAAGRITPAAVADQSVKNLSSIMVHVEAGKRTMLLLGDGLGDEAIAGLRAAKKLGADGRLHVDLMKVPHHGSERNVSLSFFEHVTADGYVLSANGKNDNPDTGTLEWILEAAEKAGRKFTLYATNRPPSLDKFVKKNPPGKHGYALRVRPANRHYLTVKMS